MPNTKSAERRVRSSARKESRNTAVISKVKTLEKSYLKLLQGGKKDEAASALKVAISALDKAAKAGVIKKETVDRKKSRLSIQLKKAAAPAAAK
ncbi:MAG TPA: 30S ribosomal protein S20 [Verrucomicrobiae bacterium]